MMELIYDSDINTGIDDNIDDIIEFVWENNKDGRIICYGYQDLWNGKRYGGRYLDTFDELQDRMRGGRWTSIERVIINRVCDDIPDVDVEDEADEEHLGDIVISYVHHDGVNKYTFRIIDDDIEDAGSLEELKEQFKGAGPLRI